MIWLNFHLICFAISIYVCNFVSEKTKKQSKTAEKVLKCKISIHKCKIFNLKSKMAVNGKLKYYAVARKNPKNLSQVLYYAQLYQYSLIERDQILEAASRNSSIPKAYIGMVYDALGEEILNFVRNGHSITLANFGTIYTTLRSRPSETADKVDAYNVKKVKFHFKPCARLRKALAVNLLSFEKVQKVKGNYQAPAEP